MINKISLVLTTINKNNKNIKNLDTKSKKNGWNLIIIGDKKTPKNFELKYGNFLNVNNQKKIKLRFSKICPYNNYARKNIGYLIAMQNNSDIIVETDDDNYPNKNFFRKIYLKHNCREILNKDWINIYNLFLDKKKKIWPRGLPLTDIDENKIRISGKKTQDFYIQQGVCDNNPDVDAIYRLLNKNINIKFKNNFNVSLGKAFSPFNSQNTIWFKKVFPLMYLPITCTMRSTDILRSLIAIRILQNDKKKILFFGTTMFQNRNEHNLIRDFEDEIPIYLNCKKIINILFKLKLKKQKENYYENLIQCYNALIKNKIFYQAEKKYLKAWINDCKKINNQIN